MAQIVSACFSPHPPIILPSVGSPQNRAQVQKTIEALENLGQEFKEQKPNSIIISSPHRDWGFNVPLHFIAKDFEGEIKTFLTGLESPQFYFEKGKNTYKTLKEDTKYALIGSGDLSHCLKTDGPYGFHQDGPEFDKALIEYLKKKDIGKILKLNEYFPEAGECGLRSFCFILGILEAHSEKSKKDWQAEILSYEGPFGVGYLVSNFKLK